MSSHLALSGNQSGGLDAINLLGFTKAFIAELVSQGVRDLEPRAPNARRGFACVVSLLDERVEKLEDDGRGWQQVLPLASIANELRESANGGVEGWERALRLAQLTFTTVGNPDYDQVEFSIDSATAVDTIERLPETQQLLAREAVERFMKEWRLGA